VGGTFATPILGERGGRMRSAMADGTIERPMVVFCWLSIVTVALSLTIRSQFAIECARRSNQQMMGQLGKKFGKE